MRAASVPLCFRREMRVKLVTQDNLVEAATRLDRFRFWADPLGVEKVRGSWMRCGECGTNNPDGNSFCQSCGVKLGIVCLQCGHQSSGKARFCGACGMALSVAEGERKHATIMFADIVGSTQLITGLDAEQALLRRHDPGRIEPFRGMAHARSLRPPLFPARDAG